MAEGRIKNTDLSAIAAAIRSKNGESTVYKPAEMAQAILDIPSGTTPTGTVSITQNGTTDVTQYASAAVNVPNSYAAADEGKVVQSGALVAQTNLDVAANGTYNTTTNNSVVVNVEVDDPFALTDYIESSGTQHIDTGYAMKSNSRIEMVANILNSYSGNPAYFGVCDESSGYFYFTNSQARLSWVYATVRIIAVGSRSYLLGRKATYRCGTDGFKINTDGLACTFDVTDDYTPSTKNLYIFTINENGAAYQGKATMKLYRFRIYEDDALVMELLPYEDNGEACLKDSITGTIYRNAGTGAFTYGSDT